MVITEYLSDIEECIAIDETQQVEATTQERPRDALGHCWDGLPCDHVDHGPSGTIHFMR
jgi:hypothetical protein